MKAPLVFILAAPVFLAGCTSSPRSQEMVRRSTAAVTRTVASDVKGAALGIRDGLRHNPDNDSVDINTAPLKQLQTLQGVTPAMAEQIVRNRPYTSPGDLRRRGVVPRTVYGNIRSRLVARETPGK